MFMTCCLSYNLPIAWMEPGLWVMIVEGLRGGGGRSHNALNSSAVLSMTNFHTYLWRWFILVTGGWTLLSACWTLSLSLSLCFGAAVSTKAVSHIFVFHCNLFIADISLLFDLFSFRMCCNERGLLKQNEFSTRLYKKDGWVGDL